MSDSKDPKSLHEESEKEAERRKQQSVQDKQNQSREDQRRPDQTHGTHNQADKQIAPEQRSQDSK